MKTADLVTFTEEILNVKLQFLCSIMAPKNGISVSPWQDNAFFTKEFQNWNKTLYSEKDKLSAFEKHQDSQSYKTAVLHQKNINTVKAIKQQFYYQKNMVKF